MSAALFQGIHLGAETRLGVNEYLQNRRPIARREMVEFLTPVVSQQYLDQSPLHVGQQRWGKAVE